MVKHSPSVNIIRDTDLNYIVTPNATRVCEEIFQNFEKGYHSFNLIGSFGTGKSSFLLALEKTLKREASYFNLPNNTSHDVIKIIGEYESLIERLAEEFDIQHDHNSNQKLFDAIYQRYESRAKENGGFLVIILDEFGKYLEYAAKNNPENEVYFLQKLAEFVNEPKRNIVLITSVHQSLESYAYDLEKAQSQEWRKVKGRFSEHTFNEPVEQLLFLASKQLNSSANFFSSRFELIEKFKLYQIASTPIKEIENNIYPLDIISAYGLAIALQRYGQNERSLFTFLNSVYFLNVKEENNTFLLHHLYDYLFQEFYHYIISKSNPDYINWASLRNALERTENLENLVFIAQSIVKAIGLLNVLAGKGARLNKELFIAYYKNVFETSDIKAAIVLLEQNKIIRYSRFNDSYKLFEGTDLDIELAIAQAANRVGGVDVLGKLNSHFDFPVIIAKAVSYRRGTPRLFKFLLSNQPIAEKAEGEIDGYINLIFNEKKIDEEQLLKVSENSNTLYGYFTNTSGIFETLEELEKTKAVLRDMRDQQDLVAVRELESIIRSNEKLLNHFVMSSLYSNKVNWYSLGGKIKIDSKKRFNKTLSLISEYIYEHTPVLKNELFNRHKTSGSISSARKNFWRALTSSYQEKNLGFPDDKWPAEKTIYHTLLKNTGIHREIGQYYELGAPTQQDFLALWETSLRFLDEAKSSRKSLLDFAAVLGDTPLKLKQGVIDFWLPTFLFIKRGDFALYNENGFVPYIDEQVLYFLTRNLKEYSIKSFELNNLRLSLFNKYRSFLQQDNTASLDTTSFIESIRPLLIFYKDLPDYNKKTKTISKEAIALREAISKAKDPEKTFFEDFPDALGYNLKELAQEDQLFEDYIVDFQNRLEEIKNSFDLLLERIELFICNELIGEKVPFEIYKKRLQDRFSAVKEHQALTRHKMFLLRINSNLPDRNSYLMSLGQAIIGKRLDQIKDNDEQVFLHKFQKIAEELDNLSDLHQIEKEEGEKVIKLQLTNLEDGSKEKIVRLTQRDAKEVEHLSKEFLSVLDKQKKLKLPILLSLLSNELNENEET